MMLAMSWYLQTFQCKFRLFAQHPLPNSSCATSDPDLTRRLVDSATDLMNGDILILNDLPTLWAGDAEENSMLR